MKKERLFFLDFVRVVSMFIIIIFHFIISVDTHMIYSKALSPFNVYGGCSLGNIGVSVFFIVSGIGLVYSYSNNNTRIKNFYKKRFLSIYPYFWVAYILVYVFYFLKYKTTHPFTPERNPITIIETILGIDGYLTPYGINFYILGEWFLGAIIIMYIIFPILVKLLNFNFVVSMIVVVLFVPLFLLKYDSPIQIDHSILFVTIEFYTGLVIGKVLLDADNRKFIICLFTIASLVGFFVIGFIQFPTVLGNIINIYFLGVFVYSILAFIGKIVMKNITINKIVMYLSKVSFTTYLLHHVISEQIISTFDGRLLTESEVVNLFVIIVAIDILGGLVLKKIVDNLILNIKN